MLALTLWILFSSVLLNVLLIFRIYFKSDGKIVITTSEEGIKRFSLELDRDPEELENQDRICFKVVESQENHPL